MSDLSETNTEPALARPILDLDVLLQIDHDLREISNFDKLLDVAHKWISRISKSNHVRIFLLQEDEKSRFLCFPDDKYGDASELIEKALKNIDLNRNRIVSRIEDKLIFPISNKNKPLGLFLIQREIPFSKNEVDYLALITNRCASSIVTAELNHALDLVEEDKLEYVSLVTHELRNPLTCIKGYADLLIQGVVGPINEQQRDFIEVLLKNVDCLSTLLTDLGEYSRVESGRIEMVKKRVPVQNCLYEVLENLLPKFDEKQQTLKLEFEPGIPEVYTDPDRLIQIMNNLLSNAQRYTPVGGDIRVFAKSIEGFVQVEVVDNGIGISPDAQSKLFSKFFRSEDPIVREEPGWGLGLYVAKHLVKIMGGDIGYRSKPSQGSDFWFTIPVSEDEHQSTGGI